ncbi:MAG: hypothetical protein HQ574_09415 [Chloroflexi bacterium]|nr:hypothetical protein [Chloroflexota bacterium]
MVPWGDLLITGPLSLLAAFGVARRKSWGYVVGLMVCGIYLFGSALVYISLIWDGAPYPLKLVFPPVVGIGFGISFPIWIFNNPRLWSVEMKPASKSHMIKQRHLEEVLV